MYTWPYICVPCVCSVLQWEKGKHEKVAKIIKPSHHHRRKLRGREEEGREGKRREERTEENKSHSITMSPQDKTGLTSFAADELKL